ncbi:tripartite tricarboxylate transporter TctB family protein [Vibrio sp. 1-Bac 57]|uniref:tripartite tricarboxylate transporter TctB family protein n=1 Tax=Psychromonas sp. SA13A TaxID=2686346 RepID=UPI00140A47F8|nr:tripartite tricarboxylate transporter TctB family protein [Psychromonas sp. SA13A]
MRKGKLVLAGVFITLSLFIIAFALELPASRKGVPGPGTWPILISLIMLFSAITVAIKSFNDKDKKPLGIAGKEQVRVYLSMISLVIYLIAMTFIGFAVSTFVMLYGFITWFSSYKWYFRVISSFAITAVIYCVFHYVLKVPFRFGVLF